MIYTKENLMEVKTFQNKDKDKEWEPVQWKELWMIWFDGHISPVEMDAINIWKRNQEFLTWDPFWPDIIFWYHYKLSFPIAAQEEA